MTTVQTLTKSSALVRSESQIDISCGEINQLTTGYKGHLPWSERIVIELRVQGSDARTPYRRRPLHSNGRTLCWVRDCIWVLSCVFSVGNRLINDLLVYICDNLGTYEGNGQKLRDVLFSWNVLIHCFRLNLGGCRVSHTY